MPQTLQGLRISSPEIIYDRLDQPTSADADVTIVGLGRLFDITLRGSLGPSRDRAALEAISDAMIEDTSGVTLVKTRPIQENTKRVFNLAITHPWLRTLSHHGSVRETMFEDEFWAMFKEHTVDDYPGLFGVTLREARIIRAKVHEPGYDLTDLAKESGLYDQEAFQ
jgi:hypothetical protein